MKDFKLNNLLLVNGQLQAGEGALRPIIDPSSGQVLIEIADASVDQTLSAIAAAKKAQPLWAKLSPLARAQYMKRIAVLVRRDSERLAHIVVLEQGKPINEARGEVAGTAEFFDYFAEFARRIEGEILPSDHAGEQIWIQRVPIGVVGAIIPWNYPSALFSRKVAPSMIAGNTVVLKAHEQTPLSSIEMARIVVEAGVPAGVVNVVTGAGALVGEIITSSPDVNMITMTGSVPTGKRIMATASSLLTPLSLELGGKAPFIVMPDCDLDFAVRSAVTSRYMNCGQVCICNERTLVHSDVYDEFVKRFIEASRNLRIGNPLDISTDLGPKFSIDELEKVERFVELAVDAGAKVLLGGRRPKAPPTLGGYWYEPTVLTQVDLSMEIMHKEVFGPVLPIFPFSTFDEAITIANDSYYGLSAYLFTQHMPTIMRAVNDLQFGEVYVNRVGPESLQGFHVGYKNSGLGGDDGIHGLEAYLRKKTVYVNYSGGATVSLMPYRV